MPLVHVVQLARISQYSSRESAKKSKTKHENVRSNQLGLAEPDNLVGSDNVPGIQIAVRL